MSRLKEVALKFACKYLLAPKPVSEIMPNVLCIDCEESDITRILDTSNNILRIRIDDRHVYFRECKRHTEIHQYVANEIGYYYLLSRTTVAKHSHLQISQPRLLVCTPSIAHSA